jgi:hypothetical protein
MGGNTRWNDGLNTQISKYDGFGMNATSFKAIIQSWDLDGEVKLVRVVRVVRAVRYLCKATLNLTAYKRFLP